MSEEIPSSGDSDPLVALMPPPKMVNGDRINGVSNGHSSSSDKHRSSSSHHKSSSKDKHRDRDRDKDRDHKSSKSSHHSSSSSSKDKHSSSHSSHDKDRDKSSSDKDRHSSSHKSSSRDKDRKDRDKDKHSSSSSSKDKDKEKSSRDKDKDRDKERSKDKDKDRDRNRDKDKERSKDHKSSSTDKDKDKEKSRDKDKDKETRDKDKDKESRDKDKDRHHKSSSSSSKKHSSSSSSSRSKDKDRDRDRDKNRHSSSKSSSSKSRHRDDNKDEIKKENDIKIEIKDEPDSASSAYYSPQKKTNDYAASVKREEIKIESINNVSQASSCDYSLSQFRADEESFKMKDPLANSDNDDTQDYDTNMFNSSQQNENGDDDDGEYKADQDGDNDEDDDEDIPIAKRKKTIEPSDDEDEDIPLTARKKVKTQKSSKKAKKKKHDETDEEYDDYEEDERPKKKKIKKEKKKEEKQIKREPTVTNASPTKVGGRKKKEEEPQEVWKWWEEEKKQDNTKWNFLEHKGPVFAPPYIPLPDNIRFEYDGKTMKLSSNAEEIACFYAKMLEHEYTSKQIFNDNFFKDWRKAMTSKEKEKITKLNLCNFRMMHAYFTEQSERNKNRTKEEKAALKAENEALVQEYGFCTIDGHKERIGNFKIEPPGLFRGRGEHPKMGMVKNRIQPEDVLINCSKNSQIPVPPDGHKWKEVRHDNNVTWLASWCENVQGQVKYVMLNPSSKLKGEKDWQKYEIARKLHRHIDKIRNTYRDEWKSKEMRIRQRAVALYFIDKLALRAGNEKDEDQADTVGCCSLRVEHIELHKRLNGKENVVVFDFLGKDSIRYYNEVEVEKRVFKNLELFKENKKDGDDLFDRLNTVVMNEHLRELMEGLTAKVFRTYNASYTLQCQLNEITDPDASLPEKLLAYNRANRAVAILCNHQRSVPKSHEKSMENLKEKIRAKREQLDDLEVETADAVKAAKRGSMKEKIIADKKKKSLERCKEQLKKLELQETDRDENKTIALGTSKLNYLDPRISVAWCKKHNVPIEKIYNKTQRDKFRWAIDMATEDYIF